MTRRKISSFSWFVISCSASQLAGSDCEIIYQFNDNDKFVGGTYNFTKRFANPQFYITDYNKFKEYAKKAELKACRIPCVLGNKFTNEILCEMVDKKLLSKSADMNAIEVSINMSHFNAWQKISNSCLKYGLIL